MPVSVTCFALWFISHSLPPAKSEVATKRTIRVRASRFMWCVSFSAINVLSPFARVLSKVRTICDGGWHNAATPHEEERRRTDRTRALFFFNAGGHDREDLARRAGAVRDRADVRDLRQRPSRQRPH